MQLQRPGQLRKLGGRDYELGADRPSTLLSRWLTAADGAGLDENGIVALFTSELRDFYERISGSPARGGAARCDGEGVA